MVGPKKPPRLPTELIRPIPDAAAVPVRIIDGMDQNGPLDKPSTRSCSTSWRSGSIWPC
jgi:hypothetical protein